MVKRIKKVTKGKVTRERKKLVVIGAEGLNKTEILYFKELENKQNVYHCIFARGSETDPVKIVLNTAKKARKEEVSFQKGDMAISVFDLDVDEAKYAQLEEARVEAGKRNVRIVSSNPCFEIWYLEHFGYTTKPFIDSNAVIRELEKKMPGYRKNRCDFDTLYPKTEEAIINCEKLDKYHADNNVDVEFANPRSSVYKIVKILFDKGGEQL